MKRIKNIILICILPLLLTGCVKYNANMDIKKDKSMDFSIIYALNTSIFGEEEIITEEDKSNLEKQGFTVNDYSQDALKGVEITKKINNIDTVSSLTDSEYSLSGILENKSENNYIFKVKKGIIKNTYTAKFKFDTSDSDLNTTTEEDDTYDLYEEDEDNGDSLDLSSDTDLSGYMSSMDLSFNVTLPYSAINSNATTTNNDNKNLSWNLASNNIETIEFEFELYNMTNIYIGVGIIVILIIIIISSITNNKNKQNTVPQTTELNQDSNNIDNQQTEKTIKEESVQVPTTEPQATNSIETSKTEVPVFEPQMPNSELPTSEEQATNSAETPKAEVPVFEPQMPNSELPTSEEQATISAETPKAEVPVFEPQMPNSELPTSEEQEHIQTEQNPIFPTQQSNDN